MIIEALLVKVNRYHTTRLQKALIKSDMSADDVVVLSESNHRPIDGVGKFVSQ